MFYLFSRIFAWVAEPLAYIIICFVLAFFLPQKLKRTRLSLAIAAIIMTLLFTNPMLYTCAERAWINSEQYSSDSTIYDYGIVLGGYSEYDIDRNTIEYYKSADRLFTAIRYYRNGRVRQIVVSGDGATSNGFDTFTQEMQQLYDIPGEALIMEPFARTTRENAALTASMLGDISNKNVAVFTSAIHIPRAQIAFRQEGINATFIPCDFRHRHKNPIVMWTPNPEIIVDWGDLIHEWIGCLAYTVFH